MEAKIYGQMAKLTALIPAIGVDSKAIVEGQKGRREYKYASLASLHEVLRPLFSACELFFTQTVQDTYMVTRFYAADGSCIESQVPMPSLNGLAPQHIGSALTYMKRYGLTAALGIEPDKDDDASAAQVAHETKKVVQAPTMRGLTDAEFQAFLLAGLPAHTTKPAKNDASKTVMIFNDATYFVIDNREYADIMGIPIE